MGGSLNAIDLQKTCKMACVAKPSLYTRKDSVHQDGTRVPQVIVDTEECCIVDVLSDDVQLS